MDMGFAPTWLRQVSPLLHKTTLTTDLTHKKKFNIIRARYQHVMWAGGKGSVTALTTSQAR